MYKGHYFQEADGQTLPSFQVQIHSEENPKMLRDLQSNLVNQLVVVPGIITAASKTQIKATQVTVRCGNCGHEKKLKINLGFSKTSIPRQCDNASNPGIDKQKCSLDPYKIVPELCTYVDQQFLKLQEAPELIPTGEMPRTFSLTVDRHLADKVTPGNRVKVVGVLSIRNESGGDKGGRNVKVNYIRVVGIMSEANKDGSPSTTGFALPNISQEDEEKITSMAKDPNVFDKISRSIASAIYGQQDIKKAIACLLFSGSPKKLPDGMKLRGDINLLLLGDPSTAKSQFLKFVERVAPISVYTSGKGSSAAGLTASVIKDSASGEF